MIKIIFLITLIMFALITKGFVERIIWLISGIIIFKYFIIDWGQWKHRYKTIIVGILVGYMISVVLILLFQYTIKEEEIGIKFIENQKKTIILVYDGEPPTYEINQSIRNVKKKSKWSVIMLPMRLFSLKLAYEKESSIDNPYYYHYVEKQLIEELDDQHSISTAYLYKKPYLKEVIQQTMKDGSGQLIICPIVLTESYDYQEINKVISDINPLQYRVKVKNTTPLWDSEVLARSFAEKILQQVKEESKSRIGLLLVTENLLQTENSPIHIKQEMLFIEKLKDFLISQGFLETHISISAIKGNEIEDKVERLLEYGVKEIVVMQVSETTEKIGSTIRLKKAIKNSEVPEEIRVEYISGWKYNRELISELVRKIRLLNLMD